MNRQLMAQLAQTGGINSGGAQEAIGHANARLAADQGARLSNYLQQGSQSALDRALQLYSINTSAGTAQKQIDSQQAIAQMNNDTQRLGITTNDQLQRYLSSQDNALRKYGIDAQSVWERYNADVQLQGQSTSANAMVNAAALQAAASQAIAEKNSQTQLAMNALNNQTQRESNANNYNAALANLGLQQYEFEHPSFDSLLQAYLGMSPEKLAIAGAGPLGNLLPSWMFTH